MILIYQLVINFFEPDFTYLTKTNQDLFYFMNLAFEATFIQTSPTMITCQGIQLFRLEFLIIEPYNNEIIF